MASVIGGYGFSARLTQGDGQACGIGRCGGSSIVAAWW